MTICNNCGKSIADDLRFCTECGTPVTPSENSAPTIAWQHFTPPGVRPTEISPSAVSSKRTVLIVVVTVVTTVVLLALGALVFRFFSASSSGEKDRPSAQVSPTTNLTGPGTSVGTAKSTPSIISSPSTPSSPTAKRNASEAKQAVIDTLEGWAASTRAHDLNSHMTYYADRLHTYYLKHDVSSVYVRESLRPAYDRFTKLDVSISNILISLDPTGTEATVTIDKTYVFEGDKEVSGSGKQMLWLSMATGHWRITGIRDVQVYYKNN